MQCVSGGWHCDCVVLCLGLRRLSVQQETGQNANCFNHRFYHCPHALPDKQTIEKMVIAQNVTYERVEQATDVVSNVYNDIMDLFKEEKGDE